MYKIRLVLADFDNQYVDRVAEFINAQFSSQIKLSVYTEVELFTEWLNTKEEIDLLLTNPKFILPIANELNQVGLVILLSDGFIHNSLEQFPYINKFQPGDTLVNQLLKMYQENHGTLPVSLQTSGTTKLISIYSPAGGVGKTSLTVGLATKLAEMGQSVLCLSLESVNSLIAKLSFTNQSGEAGFSHLLLGLADNPDTLPLKLEMYKSTDHQRRFDFLQPPDCFLELAELSHTDLQTLLLQLKEMGKYDIILVDKESAADDKTITLLNYSHKIVFLQTTDATSQIKARYFLQQLEQLGNDTKERIMQKLIPVINKYDGSSPAFHREEILNYELFIPFIEGLSSIDDYIENFDVTGQFVQQLHKLAQTIMEA